MAKWPHGLALGLLTIHQEFFVPKRNQGRSLMFLIKFIHIKIIIKSKFHHFANITPLRYLENHPALPKPPPTLLHTFPCCSFLLCCYISSSNLLFSCNNIHSKSLQNTIINRCLIRRLESMTKLAENRQI